MPVICCCKASKVLRLSRHQERDHPLSHARKLCPNDQNSLPHHQEASVPSLLCKLRATVPNKLIQSPKRYGKDSVRLNLNLHFSLPFFMTWVCRTSMSERSSPCTQTSSDTSRDRSLA